MHTIDAELFLAGDINGQEPGIMFSYYDEEGDRFEGTIGMPTHEVAELADQLYHSIRIRIETPDSVDPAAWLRGICEDLRSLVEHCGVCGSGDGTDAGYQANMMLELCERVMTGRATDVQALLTELDETKALLEAAHANLEAATLANAGDPA